MSENRSGFELGGRFYPWADQMRITDPVLLREVTGLSYQEFLSSWHAFLADQGDTETSDEEVEMDPVLLSGLIAVALWQQHPEWKREKVVRYVERLNYEAVTIIGDDTPEEGETPQDPPSPGVRDPSDSDTSSTTPSESTTGPDTPSEPVNRNGTGMPRSVTGFLA